MKPRVSIIIPCYNMENYVEETISSVRAQTMDEWECIIVDDASTDGSAEVIEKYLSKVGDTRIRYIGHDFNMGVAQARNTGIEAAEADLIICLDADDCLYPNAVRLMVEAMENDPLAAWAAGREQRFGEQTRQLERRFRGYEALLETNSLSVCGCFRKFDWNRVGGYRSGTMYEDWEFLIRLLYHNDRVIHVEEPTIMYRVRSGSRVHEALAYGHEKNCEIIQQLNPDIYAGRPVRFTPCHRDPVLVVIPYLDSGAQGCELELAIAGWRKHFQEDFQIVVVGDYHPVVETGDDILFIECPRVEDDGVNYRPHIDHVHKFLEVRKWFPNSKGFIYTCDDIYAYNDFTLADVQVLKAHAVEYKGIPIGPNLWQQDLAKTRRYADEHRLPHINFVCHLPVWYEWDKLLHIYRQCDAEHNSMVYEQIYFNTYFQGTAATLLNDFEDHWRYCVRDNADVRNTLRSKFRRKIWINNTVEGWNPDMEAVLRDHYKI